MPRFSPAITGNRPMKERQKNENGGPRTSRQRPMSPLAPGHVEAAQCVVGVLARCGRTGRGIVTIQQRDDGEEGRHPRRMEARPRVHGLGASPTPPNARPMTPARVQLHLLQRHRAGERSSWPTSWASPPTSSGANSALPMPMPEHAEEQLAVRRVMTAQREPAASTNDKHHLLDLRDDEQHARGRSSRRADRR